MRMDSYVRAPLIAAGGLLLLGIALAIQDDLALAPLVEPGSATGHVVLWLIQAVLAVGLILAAWRYWRSAMARSAAAVGIGLVALGLVFHLVGRWPVWLAALLWVSLAASALALTVNTADVAATADSTPPGVSTR